MKNQKINLMNLLIVQRTITPYRYELLKKLAPYFNRIEIISSKGEKVGAAQTVKVNNSTKSKIFIMWLKSIKIPYTGESRSWFFFIYPQSIFRLFSSDIILLEGTTNLINNIYLIPIAKFINKKIIWWDAGYSPVKRSSRRKLIDKCLSYLIRLTDTQIAYSTLALKYMKQYMGAKNCKPVLNTISTTYFEQIAEEVKDSVYKHKLDSNNIKLLYVGAIEKRKTILELINLVCDLNKGYPKYHLTIIGDGNYLSTCKTHVKNQSIKNITFTGRIYGKHELKSYYFTSDLFVMPGDGGLAIAQSLLFGLPAVCVSADGTEQDYIDDKRYILSNFNELKPFLQNFQYNYNRSATLASIKRLNDKKFISSMLDALEN